MTGRRLHRALMMLPVLLLPVPLLAGEGGEAAAVSPWMILPFVTLLLAVAVMPFINRHWWEHHYQVVAIGLGLVNVVYYLFFLHAPARLLHTLVEYISFIVLIGSLFVVAGGIHIRIRGKSRPLSNVFLLAIGAVLSNIVGTTGASMILIRPFIRVNKYRIKPFHIVFFIFIVSNMGGALTPIGDPPLFLGYLKGIPFFWVVEKLWLPWLVAMTLVLAVFYGMDTFSLHRLPHAKLHEAQEAHEEGAVEGAQNIFFLAVILVAVFVTDPPFLREGLMVAAALGSYFTTKPDIHRKNDFNFAPNPGSRDPLRRDFRHHDTRAGLAGSQRGGARHLHGRTVLLGNRNTFGVPGQRADLFEFSERGDRASCHSGHRGGRAARRGNARRGACLVDRTERGGHTDGV